jgi:uncharacterized protein YcnI
MHPRTTILAAAVTALVLPTVAVAHVELTPERVVPGSFTLFTVLSPNENGQPLTGLRLVIPDGLTIDAAADTPGFTTTVVEDARHRTAALAWQGGRVAPGRLAIFRFTAAVGARGTLRPTGIQTFADGSTRTWYPVLAVAGESKARDGLTLTIAVAALALATCLAFALGFVLVRAKRRVES